MNPMIIEYLAKERIAGLTFEADQSRLRAVDRSHETPVQSSTRPGWTAMARSRAQVMGGLLHVSVKPSPSCACQAQVKWDCC